MKVNKLLILGATAILGIGLVACGGTTSSSVNPADYIDDAADYLYQMYREESTKTTSDFERVNILILDYGTYDVDWTVSDISEADSKYVKVVEGTGNYDTIEIETAAHEINYTLTATISYEEVTKSVEFKYSIPAIEKLTIAEFIEKKDADSIYSLQGVITAVNKVGEAGSFVISDETGSIFSYDSANVTLGDEVVLTGTYDDFNGFHQLASPTIVEVIAQDKLSTIVGAKGEKATTFNADTIAADLSTGTEALVSKYAGKFLKLTDSYLLKNSKGYAGGYTAASNGKQIINIYANKTISYDDYLGKKVDIYGFVRGVSSSYLTVQVLTLANPGEEVNFAPTDISTDPAENIDIAADDLAKMYTSKTTLVDYDLVTKLEEEYGTYDVSWAVNVDSGVTLGTPANDKVTVSVVPTTTALDYTLTATISYEDTTKEVTFDKTVPAVQNVENISSFRNIAYDKNSETYYQLTGVVTAVNKVDAAGAFVIADSSAAVFSYNTLNVTLGDEITIYAMRGENYGLPQVSSPVLKEVVSHDKLETIVGENCANAETLSIAQMKEALTEYADDQTVAADYSSKLYKVTGGYACASGNFVNLYEDVEGKKLISDLYVNSSIKLDDLKGKQVDVYGYVRGMNAESGKFQIQVLAAVEAGQALTL